MEGTTILHRRQDAATRHVCRCGTVVLFPAGVTKRSCWNCKAVINITPGPNPVGLPPPPPTVTQRLESSADVTQRLESSADSETRSETSSNPDRFVDEGPRNCGSSWLWFFLALSLLLNGFLLLLIYREDGLESKTRHLFWDTDGDGVPDHHDFCPSQKKGARKKWTSGRATDFDGDGCEDGVEDEDKDNDGVADRLDSCPFTPQRYEFSSNYVSDFDGDGCADGLEDRDDDGDKVLNFADHCPRTQPGQTSDGAGCSRVQREDKASGKPGAAPWQLDPNSCLERQAASARAGPKKAEEASLAQEWFDLLRSAWVEVLLGAALSSLLTQADALRQQLPTGAHKVRRMSSAALETASRKAQHHGGCWAVGRKLFLRALVYTAFFLAVYGYRAAQRLQLQPPAWLQNPF